MFFQLFEFLITFLESYLAIMLVVSILVDQKEDIRKNSFIAFLVTVVVIVLNQRQLLAASTTIAAVLSLAILARLLYPVRLPDAILAATFFSVLTYMVDFFNMAALGTLFSDERFGYNVTVGFSWYRILYICACKLVLSCVCILLSKKILRYVGVQIRKVWIAAILGVVAVVYFGINTMQTVTADLVWTWLFMLLFFVLAIYAVMQYVSYAEEKHRLKIALERNLIQLETYNRVIRAYQANQTFLHDLKNQYLILENYLKDNKYAEAETYITELQQLEYESQCETYTGMLPIDILLSYKVEEARAKQVDIQIETEELELKISEQDLVSLVGNLLDYAMDTCLHTSVVLKSINVKMKKQSDSIHMEVMGPMDIDRKKQRASTETGRIALDGIKMLVSKYEGTMEISNHDHMWSIIIVLKQ